MMQNSLLEQIRSLILLGAFLTVIGCSPDKLEKPKSENKKPAVKPVLVELATVERGMIEQVLERSAPLEAEAQVLVLARTQNPAIELFVEEGDLVEQGQVLLRLESDRQQTAYEQAMSNLETARVDYETQKKLFDQELISDSAFRTVKFTYEQARLQSETAKRELGYTEVRAPIKGTITSRTVKVGDQVVTGNPIFEIIDLESTVAIIHVPEQYLLKLKENMEARMISGTLNNATFSGYVKRISPIVEAQSGTIKVVVGVKELGALRPGMWVDVNLVLETKDNAILIPKRSIVYDNDQTFAFKTYTDTNGIVRAKRHLVVPLNTDKEHIEPTSSFSVGDQIVVAGQGGLKDEAPIRELEASLPVPETNAPPVVTPSSLTKKSDE